MTAEQQPAQPARSPFAGCLIFLIIGLTVCGLIFAVGYVLKKQTTAIADFTESEETPAPIAPHQEAPFSQLSQELQSFQEKITQEQECELKLTISEINILIAQHPKLSPMRGKIYFEKIENDALHGILHLPLQSTHKLPKWVCQLLSIEQRNNQLQAKFQSQLLLTNANLFLTLGKLSASKGELPEPIREALFPFNLSAEINEDPEIAPTLTKLTSAELLGNQVILRYSPDQIAPTSEKEAQEVTAKIKNLIALGALIFILSMILLFVLLSKRKKIFGKSA